MRQKADLITVKILRSDAKKIKLWAVQRDKKFYEVVNKLINK